MDFDFQSQSSNKARYPCFIISLLKLYQLSELMYNYEPWFIGKKPLFSRNSKLHLCPLLILIPTLYYLIETGMVARQLELSSFDYPDCCGYIIQGPLCDNWKSSYEASLNVMPFTRAGSSPAVGLRKPNNSLTSKTKSSRVPATW
jgi:hypothetical protein